MKIGKKKSCATNSRENNLLLPAHAELLVTHQKSPGDGLCFIRWAGSSKPAEVLVRKMRLMPMGQHCSNQLLSRDPFLRHLPLLSQHSPAEGKTSSFEETSALLWNTAKLPVQVGVSCQPVPRKTRWHCQSKQSENKVAVFLLGNWAAGRLLLFSQRETLKKLSSFYYFFCVLQFLAWYSYFSKELWYICVYVHPHMMSVCLKGQIHQHEHRGEVLTTLEIMGILSLIPVGCGVNQNPETLLKVKIFCKEFLYCISYYILYCIYKYILFIFLL